MKVDGFVVFPFLNSNLLADAHSLEGDKIWFLLTERLSICLVNFICVSCWQTFISAFFDAFLKNCYFYLIQSIEH